MDSRARLEIGVCPPSVSPKRFGAAKFTVHLSEQAQCSFYSFAPSQLERNSLAMPAGETVEWHNMRSDLKKTTVEQKGKFGASIYSIFLAQVYTCTNLDSAFQDFT